MEVLSGRWRFARLTTEMTIYFYSTKEKYGAFSNFSRHPLDLDGLSWPTSEHYFQAQKFTDKAYREKIRATPSPTIAARLGRSRKQPIRADWDEIRVEVMHRVVLAKFKAYPDLRELLLSTGEEEIVEKTNRDDYWGCGADGTGKNALGRILMRVRSELQNE